MSIEDLAPEILQNIFDQALPAKAILSVREPPLLIAHVSPRWREIAFDTSSFWTNFVIDAYTGATHRQLLDLWLERSGQKPLRFGLNVPYYGAMGSMHARIAPLIASLDSHAERWKEAELTIPNSLMVPLVASAHCQFPLLESLTLRSHGLIITATRGAVGAPPGSSLQRSPRSEQAFPRLRNLVLSGTLDILDKGILPWHKLLSLQSVGDNVDDALYFLEACSSLEYFQFFWSRPGSAITRARLPLFRSLRGLRITSQTLLPALNVPALTHLHLHSIWPRAGGPEPLETISSLVARSGCTESLESLIIDEGIICGRIDSLPRLLASLPALAHLSLKFDHDPLPGIMVMAPILEDVAYIPKLRSLILRGCHNDEDDSPILERLLDALKQRVQQPHPPLQRVEITVQAWMSRVMRPRSGRTAPEEEYYNRHQYMVPTTVVKEFQVFAAQSAPLEVRLVAARPIGGFRNRDGAFKYVNQVLVNTWGQAPLPNQCWCTFCLSRN
ncbi:F-box domain-containing protein [Mycena chlorophos]|uniref:F-box domain-containing protein n=1 Tax=Mycena chlorophos TaxID=658473 RepID=A0A8H6SUI4_MYCCL|nr:F-box domain-containing protein [Mycena chlorophos]